MAVMIEHRVMGEPVCCAVIAEEPAGWWQRVRLIRCLQPATTLVIRYTVPTPFDFAGYYCDAHKATLGRPAAAPPDEFPAMIVGEGYRIG